METSTCRLSIISLPPSLSLYILSLSLSLSLSIYIYIYTERDQASLVDGDDDVEALGEDDGHDPSLMNTFNIPEAYIHIYLMHIVIYT